MDKNFSIQKSAQLWHFLADHFFITHLFISQPHFCFCILLVCQACMNFVKIGRIPGHFSYCTSLYQSGPEEHVNWMNWTKWTELRHLAPVPWTELNELPRQTELYWTDGKPVCTLNEKTLLVSQVNASQSRELSGMSWTEALGPGVPNWTEQTFQAN